MYHRANNICTVYMCKSVLLSTIYTCTNTDTIMNWSELVVVTLLLEPYSLKVTVGVPDYWCRRRVHPASPRRLSSLPVRSSWPVVLLGEAPILEYRIRRYLHITPSALRYQPPCPHLTYLITKKHKKQKSLNLALVLTLPSSWHAIYFQQWDLTWQVKS